MSDIEELITEALDSAADYVVAEKGANHTQYLFALDKVYVFTISKAQASTQRAFIADLKEVSGVGMVKQTHMRWRRQNSVALISTVINIIDEWVSENKNAFTTFMVRLPARVTDRELAFFRRILKRRRIRQLEEIPTVDTDDEGENKYFIFKNRQKQPDSFLSDLVVQSSLVNPAGDSEQPSVEVSVADAVTTKTLPPRRIDMDKEDIRRIIGSVIATHHDQDSSNVIGAKDAAIAHLKAGNFEVGNRVLELVDAEEIVLSPRSDEWGISNKTSIEYKKEAYINSLSRHDGDTHAGTKQRFFEILFDHTSSEDEALKQFIEFVEGKDDPFMVTAWTNAAYEMVGMLRGYGNLGHDVPESIHLLRETMRVRWKYDIDFALLHQHMSGEYGDITGLLWHIVKTIPEFNFDTMFLDDEWDRHFLINIGMDTMNFMIRPVGTDTDFVVRYGGQDVSLKSSVLMRLVNKEDVLETLNSNLDYQDKAIELIGGETPDYTDGAGSVSAMILYSGYTPARIVHEEVDVYPIVIPNPVNNIDAFDSNLFQDLTYDQMNRFYDYQGSSNNDSITSEYCGDAYEQINRILRGRGAQYEEEEYKELTRNFIKEFEAISMTLPHAIEVSRKLNHFSDYNRLGKMMVDLAPLSTSFNGSIWSGKYHLRIVVPEGTPLVVAGDSRLSPNLEEVEVILPPGTMLMPHRRTTVVGQEQIECLVVGHIFDYVKENINMLVESKRPLVNVDLLSFMLHEAEGVETTTRTKEEYLADQSWDDSDRLTDIIKRGVATPTWTAKTRK